MKGDIVLLIPFCLFLYFQTTMTLTDMFFRELPSMSNVPLQPGKQWIMLFIK